MSNDNPTVVSSDKCDEANKPLVLVIMDGVGIAEHDHGNTLKHAEIPHLKKLMASCPYRTLKAHGRAVGLPSDKDMGNSEVGHNALGSGQIYAQGASLVNQAIETGRIFASEVWREAVRWAKRPGQTLHFIGLLSDGNVHSHIDQLKALIGQAQKEGVSRVAVHALLDGRDVESQSAERYIQDLEKYLAELNQKDNFYSYIASGGGRMKITMDRYEADWDMVARGWQTHVAAQGQAFPSALDAVERFRQETPDISDQDLPAFVIADREGKLQPMVDGDAVILFNFRGDRALEISRAFDSGDEFQGFKRDYRPEVYYAGILEYDGDLHIPRHYLVDPPDIQHTLTEELLKYGKRLYAVSETQKFGHVTYFWNGNRQEKFSEENETWEEIASDRVDFAQKPWMKAYEITEALIRAMASRQYDFLRANFANGDMVGHTGNYQAATIALETVDLCLGRLIDACDEFGYSLLVVADHGNCDEMLTGDRTDPKSKPKTSHSLAPVPFILYGREGVSMSTEADLGLANVAAGVAELLGVRPRADWEASPFRFS